MTHATSKRLALLAAVIGLVLIGTVAWAHPLDLPALQTLLGQVTGGSFGGSSWGSGGSGSGGGSGSSGGSGSGGGSSSGGDGIAGFFFSLLLELLWQMFLLCARRYPIPTFTVVAVLGLFLWSSYRDPEGPAVLTAYDAPRPDGLTHEDREVVRGLSQAMTRTGRVGVVLSAVVGVAGIATLVRLAHPVASVFAGLAALATGIVGAVVSWHALQAAHRFEHVDADEARRIDRVTGAVTRLGDLFSWTGTLLVLLLAATALAILVCISL